MSPVARLHGEAESEIKAIQQDRARLLRALRHMVEQADRGQRPGGGSDVPQWVRDVLARAELKP